MQNRIFLMGGCVLLGISLLSIPQCGQADRNALGGATLEWFSTFFKAKPRHDVKCCVGRENTYAIVVIGSGPAGDAAAVYGARAGKSTVVVEGRKPGGLLMETSYVENWPGFKAILGKDLMKEVKEQAMHFGAQFMDDTVEKVDFSQWPYVIYTEDGKTIYALTVIIATGALPNSLNIPGEKEYWAKGVTACAICDGYFYQGKEVVVIGGGDSAIAEAIQLAAYAKKITILVRKDKMRAAAATQELLAGYPHISVRYNVEVKKIVGDEKHVTGIELYNNKEKKTELMPIDGVFLAVGHTPNSALFKGFIKLDANGYVVLQGRTQATSLPGVFAAGDVEDHKYRQAGIAAGSGIRAALDADAFLNEIGFTNEIATCISEKQLACVPIVPSLVVHVASLADFEAKIKEAKKPLFVDFYADYCPSCMQMLPHFDAIAQEFKDYASFISIDIAALPDIAQKYHINKIPCMLVFKDGAIVGRFNSQMGKKELQEFVAQFVGQTESQKS